MRSSEGHTAAKELSNNIIHYKVSHNLILLIVICAMSSLNQVEMFGSGQSIPDDSSLSTCEGTNERKCVTDPKSNTVKFASSPIPVFSCQEHRDLSRLSSTKADTFEAILVAIKDAVSIDRYCDAISRMECHVRADDRERKCSVSQTPVQEIVSHQQRSSQSSGLFPTFLTNLLRCQGNLTGISLNPERSTDPCNVVKIRDVSRQSFTKADSTKLGHQAFIIATQCVSSIDSFSLTPGGFTTTSQSKLSVWFIVLPLSGQSRMSWSPPGILQDCIKDERDESNRRTDTTTSGADVDIIHRVKKHEVRCDKTKLQKQRVSKYNLNQETHVK